MTAPAMIDVSHRAMATEFVVYLPPHTADAADAALVALESLDAIESALTIYRPDSEVSRINRGGAESPVRVSASTFRLIEKAIRWSERTEGGFDITAGPLVEAWGFTKRSGRKPSTAHIQAALEKVGYQMIQLDRPQHRVGFQRHGMAINLGGIGKGEAIDRIERHLRDAGVNHFLIHGGNSTVVAGGDMDPDRGPGWPVGVAHPTKPKHRLAGVRLRDAALSTSGSGKQFFHHRGKRYGHVIDPRTGYPTGDHLSISVITGGAADADAASTGLFVGGTPLIDRLSQTNPDDPEFESLAVIAVAAGERQDEVDVNAFGEFVWVDPPPARSEKKGAGVRSQDP